MFSTLFQKLLTIHYLSQESLIIKIMFILRKIKVNHYFKLYIYVIYMYIHDINIVLFSILQYIKQDLNLFILTPNYPKY